MLKKSPSTGIQPGVAGDEVSGKLGGGARSIKKSAKFKNEKPAKSNNSSNKSKSFGFQLPQCSEVHQREPSQVWLAMKPNLKPLLLYTARVL